RAEHCRVAADLPDGDPLADESPRRGIHECPGGAVVVVDQRRVGDELDGSAVAIDRRLPRPHRRGRDAKAVDGPVGQPDLLDGGARDRLHNGRRWRLIGTRCGAAGQEQRGRGDGSEGGGTLGTHGRVPFWFFAAPSAWRGSGGSGWGPGWPGSGPGWPGSLLLRGWL